MDDSRIKALTEEVLSQLRSGPAGGAAGSDLESRVAALEAAVRGLQGASAPRAAAAAVVVSGPHPSQGLLAVGGGGGGQCVMEPDKPCVNSGACRTFGH
jgi:hypothetical protein